MVESMDWNDKLVVPLCLVYLKSDRKVLLMKRNDDKEMVPGMLMGIGGKMEQGELPIDCAKREFLEETGLAVSNLKLQASFTWLSDKEKIGNVLIYVADKFVGTLIQDTDEGYVDWYDIDGVSEKPDFAPHHKVFINRILKDENYFYFGILNYKNGEIINNVDSDAYLGL